MVASIYRKIIPLALRNKIYDAFLGNILVFLRNFDIIAKSKLTYLFKWVLPKTEKNNALAFMGRYGVTSYPYPHMLDYKNKDINVVSDPQTSLLYVVHNGRNLYFPKNFSKERIIKDYRSLITEQDIRSAHRYVASYYELRGKTLLDIGSAEGIFALDTIDITDHVYLFEYEETWFAPLKATFAPWENKVTIVKKYISNQNNETNITIDTFLENKPADNLFLKMDIEGAELQALKGAATTLKNGHNMQLAVCTYHRPGDPATISGYLASLGYSYTFTEGLMYWQKRLSKGVVRCTKHE